MTIPPNLSPDHQPDGRTVRDIIERSPALVNEVWCRKILRQLLQSLDTQYTNGAPHRLIMPDTIIVQASGDTILLPDPDANPDFQPEVAADLRALAAVIHYAITHEMPSTGPLVGRGLAGYSDSLLGAIDRCMASNKAQRPQTVAELRDLLGMVSVGLLKPSAAAPVTAAAPAATVAPAAASAPAAPITPNLGPPASSRRWLWIILAAALLAGALYFVRQHGAEELVGAAVRVPSADAPAAAPPAAQSEAPAAVPAPATPAADAAPTPAEDAAPVAEAAASTAAEPAEKDAAKDAAVTASYRLNIKPWGTIYVDGKRRGVSPPLKRLIVPAGRHTVMVENPGFADYIVQVDTARGLAGQITHDFSAAPAAAPAPVTAPVPVPAN